MPANSENPIQASEVVLPCAELESTLAFFTENLGFQINAIFPADAPLVAVISGHGVRLRLERGGSGSPGKLRLLCRNPEEFAEGATELTAPNGTCIEIVEADPPLVLPPEQQSFVLNRYSNPVIIDDLMAKSPSTARPSQTRLSITANTSIPIPTDMKKSPRKRPLNGATSIST